MQNREPNNTNTPNITSTTTERPNLNALMSHLSTGNAQRLGLNTNTSRFATSTPLGQNTTPPSTTTTTLISTQQMSGLLSQFDEYTQEKKEENEKGGRNI